MEAIQKSGHILNIGIKIGKFKKWKFLRGVNHHKSEMSNYSIFGYKL